MCAVFLGPPASRCRGRTATPHRIPRPFPWLSWTSSSFSFSVFLLIQTARKTPLGPIIPRGLVSRATGRSVHLPTLLGIAYDSRTCGELRNVPLVFRPTSVGCRPQGSWDCLWSQTLRSNPRWKLGWVRPTRAENALSCAYGSRFQSRPSGLLPHQQARSFSLRTHHSLPDPTRSSAPH